MPIPFSLYFTIATRKEAKTDVYGILQVAAHTPDMPGLLPRNGLPGRLTTSYCNVCSLYVGCLPLPSVWKNTPEEQLICFLCKPCEVTDPLCSMELNCYKNKVNSEALLDLWSPLPLTGLRDATKNTKQMSKKKEEFIPGREPYLGLLRK